LIVLAHVAIALLHFRRGFYHDAFDGIFDDAFDEHINANLKQDI